MEKKSGVIYDGYPTMEEIKAANGWPTEERFAQGPVAIAECVQEIPCNPCEGACPFHAITVGEPITNTSTDRSWKMHRSECVWQRVQVLQFLL